MGKNLDRLIDTLYLPQDRRVHFLKNLRGLAQKAEAEGKTFDLHPEIFWAEDLTQWTTEDRERLLTWLYRQALDAADNITENYDFGVAPRTVEELETEIVEMRITAGIRRVLQLRDRYKFTIVKADEKGWPYLEYLDGRREFKDVSV